MPDETPNPSSTPATPAAATVAAVPAPSAATTTPAPAALAATGTPAGQPSTVTISAEQYTALTALVPRMAEIESQQRARDEAVRAEELRLMAEKGQAVEALRISRDDADKRVSAANAERATERKRAERYAVDGELARFLSGKSLVPGASEQLTELWRTKLTAEPQGESFAVRTPGGQLAKDFVDAQIALPEYAHFLRSTNQGGTGGATGAQGSGPTPPAVASTGLEPRTLGEAVIMAFQSRKAAVETDSRIDMGAPMGLRRTATK